MVDSVYVANQPNLDMPIQVETGSWVDTVLAIAMALIAIFNVILTIHIFHQTKKDNSETAQKHRKFELMKLLILDSNIGLFYSFYDSVMEECKKLLSDDSQATKEAVNSFIKAKLKAYRRDFISLFNVVDDAVYKSLLEEADQLIDGITEVIFDQGVNLTYEPKFDEMISQPLSKSRTRTLSILYSLAV